MTIDENANPSPRARKTTRPSIALPNGDRLEPAGRVADEVGMSERKFVEKMRKLGVPIGQHCCCNYVPHDVALAAIAADVLGEPLPKRKRRRGRAQP
jgi:hypothetical protein